MPKSPKKSVKTGNNSDAFSSMMKLFFPGSGDVTQAINPWNMFSQMVGNQFSLINVQGKTLFPEMERKILSEAGSYGRQLGIISDAMRVLVKKVDINKLNEKEKLAILLFKRQIEEIDRIKKTRLDADEE